MREKITLPICGLEVQLATMSWAESKGFFQRAKEVTDNGATREEWMEQVLTQHYPAKILEQVCQHAPDVITLYNETVRYNLLGPEAIKNSLRSGTGAPTQTAPNTAAPAEAPAES